MIGSGPIVIGQAAEFDYAGTQACKALREEGVTSVLVNSNPATIMTDAGVADVTYIEPLTVPVLERIIAAERPDGLLPTLGGQTGLNLAVELADAGILDAYGVALLGTPLNTIKKAEDRAQFKKLLHELGEPAPESATVTSMDEARAFVERIGFPLIVRPAYTLGGTGGGIVNTAEEFERTTSGGLDASPVHQVLLERSLVGWKEIEYEVIRDGADNCVTICNMENFDPMGVHTGDSIVVAPSQTLTDKEYQMLRSASLRIIRALDIQGGCNVQFGLAPREFDYDEWRSRRDDDPLLPHTPYVVIEVNPRVSRSSALASKATGYPIARVAAKIAVGKTLDQIPNDVTGKTTAAFEPALDYCVVKIPRWPFDKFGSGDRSIGTQMKATGEVMAIDRSFEAAIQKAVRSLEIGGTSLLWEDPEWGKGPTTGTAAVDHYPLDPHDMRLWAIMAVLRRDGAPAEIYARTGIDCWFLDRLRALVAMERRLLSESLTPELLRSAKRAGFSDDAIGTLADRLGEQVRELRQRLGIRPVYKMVDTCAAEFEAATPYFYSTYEQENEALPLGRRSAAVIGSGPIRIGQGIEFDYCSVRAAMGLRANGYAAIMINSNPETVSTDFDTSDRLYFEALDEESVRDILENEAGAATASGETATRRDAVEPPDVENAPAAIVQFGGQTAIGLAEPLSRAGLPIIGSSAEAIDLAEDRRQFEDFLGSLGIPQPPGGAVNTVPEAVKIADMIGYPVVVRPSYVLGGRAMEIVHNQDELERFAAIAAALESKKPILIDKYFEGKEVEVDAVCDGERVLIPGIMEHIERAGVHSGDSMAVYPGINLSADEVEAIVDYTTRIGIGLKVEGMMNIQFVVMPPSDSGSEVYVIEVNPRSSRTVPFLSKVTGVPMVMVATGVMLGRSLKDQGYESGLWKMQPLVAVKAPVFSMAKLTGVDTYLGPEMKSTGEVMGVDFTFEPAVIKALIASGAALAPDRPIFLSIADRDKAEAEPLIRQLHKLAIPLYATEGTARSIDKMGIPVTSITKKLDEGHPNAVDIVRDGTVGAVVNTLTGGRPVLQDGFVVRRAAAEMRIPCYTSLDTARAAIRALATESQLYNVRPLQEYLRGPNGAS